MSQSFLGIRAPPLVADHPDACLTEHAAMRLIITGHCFAAWGCDNRGGLCPHCGISLTGPWG